MPTIKIENDNIEYTLSRRSKKYINIYLRADGEIYISAPKRVSMREIEKVLEEKYKWIKENRVKKTQKKNEIEHGKCVWYKGLEYNVKIVENIKDDIYVCGNSIQINTKDTRKEYVEKIFNKWLYKEAKEIYADTVKKFINIMFEYDIEMPKIKIRKMKSRWGSCIPTKKQVTFNIGLMCVPLSCMEYVILHELAHFIQPNHSKDFYTIIEKYMPDFKKRKDMLNKEYGNIL